MPRSLALLALLFAACARKRAPSPADAGALPPAPSQGAHFGADGSLTFGVRSTRATRLEVWLYAQPLGAAPALTRVLAPSDHPGVFAVTLSAAELQAAGLAAPVFYGYRAWGPNWPYDASWTPGSQAGFVADVDAQGDRFDPNKLLVDPYALELSHDPWQPGMADGSVFDADAANRAKDSGPAAPKSIALQLGALDTGARPARPLADDVVYEVHLKGFTRGDPALASCAGTYAAAAQRASYLAQLGVTALELMPVQETPNDDGTESAPSNYWGYSTLAFLAPDRKYACDRSPGGPTREFAAMVKAFHAAGVKVFMDVVYNHTAETGSPATLSLRGLDDAAYYELSTDGRGYADFTGLGGTTNAASPLLRDLVLASLHHFHDDLGVDGFRFDLAPVLGNACAVGCFRFDAGDPANVLNRALRELPGTPLIAEPWAIVSSGGYQLGNFPLGWSAWNDRFRDGIRTAQNKLGVTALPMGALADALAGSPSVFAASGAAPDASVNALVTHDGFTLHDLYACNQKANDQPWPYGPSPGGTDANLSWDQGGDAVAQAQAARTGLALEAMAAGVPMILGGDELSRSVKCNNNAFNLDSPATWLDWSSAPAASGLATFLARALAFRAAHPALRPAKFRDGADHDGNGLADATWLTAAGFAASSAYLADTSQHFLGLELDGAEAGDPAAAIYVAYDEDWQAVDAALPAPPAGKAWYRAADTSSALAPDQNFAAAGSEPPVGSATYRLAGRSVAIFVAR